MQLDLPTDVEAECVVLSKMLNSDNALNVSLEKLKATDFYKSEHVVIFSTLAEMVNNGQSITIESIYHMLKNNEKTKNVADINYLMKLSNISFFTHDVDYFIETLKRNSQLRQLAIFSSSLTKLSVHKDSNPTELISEMMNFCDTLFAEKEKSYVEVNEISTSKLFDQETKTLPEYLHDKLIMEKKITGLKTNFPKFDNLINGINRGHYIIVAARSGMGKTSFILNILSHLLYNSTKVLFLSLELDAAQLLMKLTGIVSGVSFERIEKGNFNLTDHSYITSIIEKELSNMNLIIDDASEMTVSQVCAKIRRFINSHGIQVVFIDYLTCISSDKKMSSREEEVQSISRKLTACAKKLKIPIICIAQLNRQNEVQARTPRKSDLRESGQIESDAHSIFMLHRPYEFDKTKDPFITELHCVKNRFGQCGFIQYRYDVQKDQYEEIQ